MKEISLRVQEGDSGMRLDLWLSKKALGRHLSFSRTNIQRLIAEGKVKLGGEPVKAHYKIKKGQIFKIDTEIEIKAVSLEAQDLPLEIVYQDEDLAVINKPCGLVVHPGAGNYSSTLVNSLLFHFKELSSVNQDRPGIIHRLDKDTSGLLLVAKNNHAHRSLSEQFSKHTIKRRYVALVKGATEFDEDVIELPIGRHIGDRKKMSVGFSKNAKYAKTLYRTLKRGENCSLLELNPFTGRTHQLRVHLAHIGHAILGDKKYGKNNPFSRLALHATGIGFLHPSSNKFMEFSTPVPEEFLSVFT